LDSLDSFGFHDPAFGVGCMIGAQIQVKDHILGAVGDIHPVTLRPP